MRRISPLVLLALLVACASTTSGVSSGPGTSTTTTIVHTTASPSSSPSPSPAPSPSPSPEASPAISLAGTHLLVGKTGGGSMNVIAMTQGPGPRSLYVKVTSDPSGLAFTGIYEEACSAGAKYGSKEGPYSGTTPFVMQIPMPSVRQGCDLGASAKLSGGKGHLTVGLYAK